ncbi:hypothetical protein CYMTET_17588 [Cymbomonas tetramitiformis]|uniref:DNA2/NAM7 helicase helicase domain-containing protein n=1 Tax=Cymbomonas tetramitiformis TaxID=36881 RepID=A0AAE0L752_9CHLO|nr:hypothetical protein CYMTET_17588 [Cymbomonas tetramitiformis]
MFSNRGKKVFSSMVARIQNCQDVLGIFRGGQAIEGLQQRSPFTSLDWATRVTGVLQPRLPSASYELLHGLRALPHFEQRRHLANWRRRRPKSLWAEDKPFKKARGEDRPVKKAKKVPPVPQMSAKKRKGLAKSGVARALADAEVKDDWVPLALTHAEAFGTLSGSQNKFDPMLAILRTVGRTGDEAGLKLWLESVQRQYPSGISTVAYIDCLNAAALSGGATPAGEELLHTMWQAEGFKPSQDDLYRAPGIGEYFRRQAYTLAFELCGELQDDVVMLDGPEMERGLAGVIRSVEKEGDQMVVKVQLECEDAELAALPGIEHGREGAFKILKTSSCHERQMTALLSFVRDDCNVMEMQEMLLGDSKDYGEAMSHSALPSDVSRSRMNASQRRAVMQGVREAPHVALLQGPPGTGKTHTAAMVVKEWLRAPPPAPAGRVDKGKGQGPPRNRLNIMLDRIWAAENHPDDDREYPVYTKSQRGWNKWVCVLSLPGFGMDFTAEGMNAKDASSSAAEKAIKFLEEENMTPSPASRKSRSTDGRQILVTGYSNIAVDNLAAVLMKNGVNVVRIGRKQGRLEEETFDSRRNRHPRAGTLDALMERHWRFPQMRAAFDSGDFATGKSIEYKLRNEIIGKADVVCATCIASASAALANHSFSRVLVDEATQAIEAATLVPLMKGCRSLVLIGDHKQLPPTLLSNTAQMLGLGQSLFQRLVDLGIPHVMLDTQAAPYPSTFSLRRAPCAVCSSVASESPPPPFWHPSGTQPPPPIQIICPDH